MRKPGDWMHGTAPQGGLELLSAWFGGRAYAKHRHDTYAICVTDDGLQAFDYRGAARLSAPGHVVVLHPDEPHDGRAGSDEGFGYRIVYVERDLDEVLLSQRRMLERDGRSGAKISDEQLRRTFSAQVSNIRRWLAAQPNVQLHTVNYRELLAQPRESAAATAEFLGGGLNVDAMAAAVDPALYRSRT